MPKALGLLVAAAIAVVAATAQQPFCGECDNGGAPPMDNTMLTITCSVATATVSSISFASYGNPSGTCGSFTVGSCNAANSSSVVSAACLGKNSCVIFPNTTTFGDPCFGVPKILAVEISCTSGTGTAIPSVLPPPPPVPLANYTAVVKVPSWTANSTGTLKIEPSIQVVSQHLLFRGSPIHDTSFQTLTQLGAAKHIRWVPWIPYPEFGIGELMPPSGTSLCGRMNWALNGQTLPITLDCGSSAGGTGGTIASVEFASFGQPSGVCGSFAVNTACHAPTSTDVITSLCVGKSSCTIDTAPGANPFGTSPPCGGPTYLAVQVTCSNPNAQHTYWNLTLFDSFLTDFWNAVDGNTTAPIINPSTQPTWLYSPTNYAWNENAYSPWYGYDRGTAPAGNVTALGDYYGRLYAYFMLGSFTDEYGNIVTRNMSAPGAANMNISMIEVFNEVDYEHAHNPVSYVADFDGVVQGVRRWVDPDHSKIQFVGLSLPNIDSTQTVVSFMEYFLNASNHAEDTRDALNWVGYHAYPTNGGYSPDPTSLAGLFVYADEFIQKVAAVDAVIAALSPDTLTALDETGTDMDGVLTPNVAPPNNNPRYWVAAGGYFAYLFSNLASSSPTVRVIGASQFMDAPGQEPSVTLVDWSSGLGTARFWTVKLLLDMTEVGDDLPFTWYNASSSGSGGGGGGDPSVLPNDLYAQAFTPSSSSSLGNRVLLVNKRNAYVDVDMSGACPPSALSTPCTCTAQVIDEFTALNPARTDKCGTGSNGNPSITLAPYAVAVVSF